MSLMMLFKEYLTNQPKIFN